MTRKMASIQECRRISEQNCHLPFAICHLPFAICHLPFAICQAKDVEVFIINKGVDATFEEDLADDVLEIIAVFSARLYGSRSRKKQKLLDEVKRVVKESATC